ncbi:MAG: hypothetical protein IJV00_06405 [Clostridia bacterium]|nr:hypothetical protein [Clostridia bacterium]
MNIPIKKKKVRINNAFSYNKSSLSVKTMKAGKKMNQQPYSPVPPQNFPGKGLCIAGLVLGIVSIVLCWWYMINIAALATSIIGLVCAVVGRKKGLAAGYRSGIGTAGLVCSIIGCCFAGVFFLTCTVCVCSTASSIGALSSLNW